MNWGSYVVLIVAVRFFLRHSVYYGNGRRGGKVLASEQLVCVV